MTIQANKKIVDAFLAEFDRCNIPGLLEMMTDDATWWVNGDPELFEGARTRSKAEIAEVWQGLFDKLEGGLAMNTVSMNGEGDIVADRWRGQGRWPGMESAAGRWRADRRRSYRPRRPSGPASQASG